MNYVERCTQNIEEQSVYFNNDKVTFPDISIVTQNSEINRKFGGDFPLKLYVNETMNAVRFAKQVGDGDWLEKQPLVDKVKGRMAQCNSAHNWNSLNVTKDSIAKELQSGNGLKFYDSRHPDALQSCMILDKDSPVNFSMQDAENHPILSKIAHSIKPSFSRRLGRFHLLIIFSRPLQPGELALLKNWFDNKFREYEIIDNKGKLTPLFAAESFKPEQYWNGTSEPEKIVWLNESNVLDVDAVIAVVLANDWNVLASIKPAKQALTAIDGFPTFPTITEEVFQYTYDEVFAKKFDSDPVAFVTQNYSKAEIKYRRTETFFDDEIFRYDTYNPFNPKDYTDQRGGSLGVVYVKGKLPTFIDRSNTHVNKNSLNHATFIDYFHAWQLRENEAYQRSFVDAREENGKFKPGYFLKIVDYICDYYKIPCFESKVKSDDVINAALEVYKDRLYIMKDSAREGVYQLRWFDFNSHVWMNGDAITFAKCYLAGTVKQLYPQIVSLKNREIEHQHSLGENSGFRKTQRVKSVQACLPSVTDDVFCSMFPHIDTFNSDDQYIPFDDKVIDIFTKEILPNVGQAKNFYKPYTGLDLSIADDDPDIQMFQSYWSKWANCEIQGRALLLYLILCVCKQAHTLRKAPVLIGRTGIGKSFYMDMLGYLINQHKYEINLASPREKPSDVFSTDAHGSAARVNLTLVGIDEVREDSPINIGALFEWLKFAIQSDRRQINVNPKAKARFFAFEKFATVVTVEEKLTIPTDPGLDGRLVYFRFKNTGKDVENHRRLITNDGGILDKILAWCLMQDVESAKAEFLQLTEHEVFTTALKAKKYDADLIYRFVYECIEITNNPRDKVTYNDLYECLNAWNRFENGCTKDIYSKRKTFEMDLRSIFQNVRLFDIPLDPKFYDREEVDKKNHRYGHSGIKLTSPATAS